MRIISKAPCRIDLAGGTLDIWPLYLFHPGAVTVNFAIDVFASCCITTRTGKALSLSSADLKTSEQFESLDTLRKAQRFKLPLVSRLLQVFPPSTGIDLVTDSGSPAGAGLAGSSALMVAVAGVLQRLARKHLGNERLREIVQNVEAQIIRVPTGCQDYYPALYGGINAVELGPEGIRRRSLAVDPRELGARIVLVYTGAPRASGINNWEVMKAHINGDREVHRNFERIATIARAMLDALEEGDWDETGRLMRLEWTHRKSNSPGITTPSIDNLIAIARRHGALGAKVCGAGGGGCVVFLVEPGAKARLSRALETAGARLMPVHVSMKGLRVRSVPK